MALARSETRETRAAVILQPGVQSLDDRATSLLPHMSSMVGGLATDLGFDRIELADPCQHPGGERRFGGDPEIVEAAPHVRPAERQTHRAVRAIQGQPLEPVIAVKLKHAAELARCPAGGCPCGPRHRHRRRRDGWVRPTAGRRPRSTRSVRSWFGHGPDRAPATSYHRQTASARTAPC